MHKHLQEDYFRHKESVRKQSYLLDMTESKMEMTEMVITSSKIKNSVIFCHFINRTNPAW